MLHRIDRNISSHRCLFLFEGSNVDKKNPIRSFRMTVGSRCLYSVKDVLDVFQRNMCMALYSSL